MFKSRQASAPVPPVSPPSIEWVRKRAKHRLIGVSVLVLAGVLLFPMLFDTQPRPIPVDIPIDIPSRQTAPPLRIEGTATAAPDATAAATASTAAQASRLSEVDDEVLIPKAAPQPETKPAAAAASAPAAPAPSKKPEAAAEKTAKPAEASKPPAAASTAAAPATKPAAPTPAAAQAAEAARAKALLEGKPTPKPVVAAAAAEGRFIVQVGAFAETGRAQQVRQQLERAGLKTYTHVADTAEGKRIRVRLGPFATRAEAEKAAGKAKATGLPAAILTL